MPDAHRADATPADAAVLLAWYDRHARALPWRLPPGTGRRADPYPVWLSEIMLQQTTVAAAAPYYQRFLARWPRVEDLAAAPLDEVLAMWAGLGYYARARKLHACAQEIASRRDGRFPETAVALAELPGIGPYTSAAIAAIAFGEPVAVVDGNVERVIARRFAIETPLPAAKPEIKEETAGLVPAERPGDFAQALMDLGAAICTPKRPACALCPWMEPCAARRQGIAETLPRRAPKAERPTRRGVAFFVRDEAGRILLRRREEEGLLGGMLEVPSTPWRGEAWGQAESLAHAPFKARWRKRVGEVAHTFTHFHLVLEVMTATAKAGLDVEGLWAEPEELGRLALPSVMKKTIALGLREDG
jgi:A/G-specific adenine glycosylase